MPFLSVHPRGEACPAQAVALSHYAGRAGDHNDLAMVGSRELARALEVRLAARARPVGVPEPALNVGWREELDAAAPTLAAMAQRLDAVLTAGLTPVTASGRCAVGLATLPVVAAHRPDAVIVWFDAHADLHTPETTTTGYLGGLAFSGPLGLWDSGLGSGVAATNAVLVGAREIDPAEQELIDAGAVTLVTVGSTMAGELRAVIAGRPVYVHLDCDVLEAGAVPTDYVVTGGMTLGELEATSAVLAESEVVGVEIGELESAPSTTIPPAYVGRLLTALSPLLDALGRSGSDAPSGRAVRRAADARPPQPRMAGIGVSASTECTE